MASELSSLFPDTYHPRRNDIANTTNTHEPQLPDNKTTYLKEPRLHYNTAQATTLPNFHPPGLPTTFVPLQNMPQPYPLHTVSHGAPLFKQPFAPNPFIQPAFAPNVPIVSPQIPSQGIHLQNSAPTTHIQAPQLSYAKVANPLRQQNGLNMRYQNLAAPQSNRNNA